MAKYLVDYYETYSKSYEVEANSKEEAEEEVRYGIQEGKLDPPENCSNSWCETEESNTVSDNEKDTRFTPFSRNELNLMYAACMAYGNKLFEMVKEIPNEPQIADLLSKKAKESWNMAVKITDYLKN